MAMTDVDEAKDQAKGSLEGAKDQVVGGIGEAKEHAQERISDLKDAAQEKKDELVAKAKQATPDSPQAGAQQVATTAKRRPKPFAAVGILAVALFIGWRLVGRR